MAVNYEDWSENMAYNFVTIVIVITSVKFVTAWLSSFPRAEAKFWQS